MHLPKLATKPVSRNRQTAQTKKVHTYLHGSISILLFETPFAMATNKFLTLGVSAVLQARKTWVAETDRRRFLDDIAPKLGVNGMSDWYTVSRKSLVEHGGMCLSSLENTQIC
jgi:hypothetical protein